MKEEIYQTIDRLYKQRNLKTLLSKLVSWFLTEELQITVKVIVLLITLFWSSFYVSRIFFYTGKMDTCLQYPRY